MEFVEKINTISLITVLVMSTALLFVTGLGVFAKILTRKIEAAMEKDESSIYPHPHFDKATPLPGFEKEEGGGK